MDEHPPPSPPRRRNCPESQKAHAWKTKEEATAGLIRILGNMLVRGRKDNHPMPFRVYPCPCGMWHMSSQIKRSKLPERPYSVKVNV